MSLKLNHLPMIALPVIGQLTVLSTGNTLLSPLILLYEFSVKASYPEFLKLFDKICPVII